MVPHDRTQGLGRAWPTALFVFSIYHYHREMIPVAIAFRKAGWHVHMLLGWSGSTALEADASAGAQISFSRAEIEAQLNLALRESQAVSGSAVQAMA
jgi:hypothetical protein